MEDVRGFEPLDLLQFAVRERSILLTRGAYRSRHILFSILK